MEARLEQMMSLDELKQEMFKSLRDTGTIESIRAQLRRRFIEKLQRHGERIRGDNNEEEINEIENGSDSIKCERWSVQERMIHGLFYDYLHSHQMEHTLAVFIPEIGGSGEQLGVDAIVQMLHLPDPSELSTTMEKGRPLLTTLVSEYVRRASVHTMSSSTQTVTDCQDHRIVLENQLRRVDSHFFAESAIQKKEPVQGLEERMLKYQREYDEICEKRLQEDLKRFQTTELSNMRVEERKKYERELEALKLSLLQEHRDRMQRLHDREHELEVSFTAKTTELETSMFAIRQELFQEMEKWRKKALEQKSQHDSDARTLTMESQRIQLWADKLRIQEQNMEEMVSMLVAEQTKSILLEKQQWQSSLNTREEALERREQTIQQREDYIQKLKDETQQRQQQLLKLEEAQGSLEQALHQTQHRVVLLEKQLQATKEELSSSYAAKEDADTIIDRMNKEQTRVVGEMNALQAQLVALQDALQHKTSELQLSESNIREWQQQLLDLKMKEANAVVDERTRWNRIFEQEQEQWRIQEQDYQSKIRRLYTQLAEMEADVTKYTSLYEEEKVHTTSLQHEVQSLSAMLAQAQTSVYQNKSSRNSFNTRRDGGDERTSSETMMMRMMEMMMKISGERRSESSFVQAEKSSLHVDDYMKQVSASPPINTSTSGEQIRYQQPMESKAAEQEAILRRRQWEEEREMQRRQRIFEEEQEEETQRQKRRLQREAELEAARQEQLAMQTMAEEKRKLLEAQIVLEQERLQKERIKTESRQRELEAEEMEERQRRERRRQEQEKKDEEERNRQRELDEEEKEERRRREQRRQEQEKKDEEERNEAMLQRAKERENQEKRQQQESKLEVEDQIRNVAREPIQEVEVKEHADTAEVLSPESLIERRGNSCDSLMDIEVAQRTSELVEVDTPHAVVVEESMSSQILIDQSIDDLNNVALADDEVRVDSHIDATIDTNPETPQKPVVSPTPDEEAINTPLEQPVSLPQSTPEEIEAERQRIAAEQKKKEDDLTIDVYRQRVMARKAAEKERLMEQERLQKQAEEERKRKLEEEIKSESENELELSGQSFAESSAASDESF